MIIAVARVGVDGEEATTSCCSARHIHTILNLALICASEPHAYPGPVDAQEKVMLRVCGTDRKKLLAVTCSDTADTLTVTSACSPFSLKWASINQCALTGPS
jgi:hypothetical protein